MAIPSTLTRKQLNRATLARQMLLSREAASPLAAIERLAGLQAQLARPPYIGLWTRLLDFRREDLTPLFHRREVVRATAMRGTLHLLSARDYLELRPSLQPMLTRGMRSVLRERAGELDIPALLAAARAYLDNQPRTFEDVRDHLSSLKLSGDERARGYAVRMHLPLVQVPAQGAEWGYPGTTEFGLAEQWLGRSVDMTAAKPHALILRYLAAFGPATVNDVQTWSGLNALREAMDELRPRLETFRDEKGRELFDLPGAPRPAEDVPAPVRFLPEFDNLVMAHDDRSRLIAEVHRSLVFQPGLRILPTFLVDGIVSGTWKAELVRGVASLIMEPFGALPLKAPRELSEEAERLVRFVEPGAKKLEVRISAPTSGAPAARPSRSKRGA